MKITVALFTSLMVLSMASTCDKKSSEPKEKAAEEEMEPATDYMDDSVGDQSTPDDSYDNDSSDADSTDTDSSDIPE